MPKYTRLNPGQTHFAVRCKKFGIGLRSTVGDEIDRHSSNAKALM